MSALSREAELVQNPGLGAVLLWRFSCGYVDSHNTSAPPQIPALFIVLPILLHRETFDFLRGTNRPSGLHVFAEKFARSELGKSDLLLGIHSRAASWRGLTWQSFQLAVQCRLMTIGWSAGTAIPLSTSTPSGVPESVRPLLAN